MRSALILVAAAAVTLAVAGGCKKKQRPAAVGPPPAGAPADADRLWALAPPGTSFGVVITARGVQHVERAFRALDELVTATPDLARFADGMHGELRRRVGVERPSLAELGLSGDQGAALFVTDAGPVAVLPVRDRARFVERTGAAPGGDTDRLGGWTCRVVAGAYVCSPAGQLLTGLGRGRRPAVLDRVGARGDLELAGRVPYAGWGPVAAAIEIRPGALSVHAVLTGFRPGALAGMANARPRVEPTSSAFALLGLPSLMRVVPSRPMAPGVTLHELADALAGPLSMTVSAGPAPTFDGQVALRDPVMVRGLVERCDSVDTLRAIGAVVDGGVCKVPVAQVAGTAEVWVDGETLRIGRRGRQPDGTIASLTSLGREIADGEWLVAAYGRGTTLGLPDESATLAARMPANAVLLARVTRLLSELALAGRVDGDDVRVVAGLRTIWDNPDDVVAELLALERARTGEALAGEALAAIARRAPASPFAGDHAVGGHGLMLPVGVAGLVSSIVVPAYLDAAQRDQVRD